MDEAKENYRKLNPFVEKAIGETQIWAAESNDFCDVKAINKKAFDLLLSDVGSVCEDGKTRARFLVGPAGSGKSHLFARLRRKLPKGQFTFAANPPLAPQHIKRYILAKIVSGMNMPVVDGDGHRPYSQLQRVMFRHLQQISKPKNLADVTIYNSWKKKSSDQRDIFKARLMKRISAVSPTGVPDHVCRVLYDVINEEKASIAVSWLAGSQHLSQNDLDFLAVHEPLGDDYTSEMMKILGNLSYGTGPLVLVFDQLDSLDEPAQIREIESLMIDLNDNSRNYYLIVSLLREKFEFWVNHLSRPFIERFKEHDSDNLATAELSGLSSDEKVQLLAARLQSSKLIHQRRQDGITDPYYPLSSAKIKDLADPSTSFARILIQKALQAYSESVSPKIPIYRATLQDFIEQHLNDIRFGLRDEDLVVNTASIADRVKELFEILWNAQRSERMGVAAGNLATRVKNFEGIDRKLECDGNLLNVVVYDVQRTSRFPNVLKNLIEYPASTMLIRDGRIPISGKVTKQRLDEFQKDKQFLHLSLDEIKTLHALGIFLAKMREGEYQNEDTDPAPLELNIFKFLSENGILLELDLAKAFLDFVDSNRNPSSPPTNIKGSNPDPVPAPKPAPVPVTPRPLDSSLLDTISRIMKKEQWMSFERLCYRASSSQRTQCDPEQIGRYLTEQPMSDWIMIYPRNVDLLNQMGIVIWNMEDE